MKKFFLAVILGAICTACIAAAEPMLETFTAYISESDVFINGEKRELEQEAVIINDRTYLPLREISEMNNFIVAWEEETKHIYLDKDVISQSDLGLLESGRRYSFYGVNEEKFSFKEYCEDTDCVLLERITGNEEMVRSPSEAAEIAEKYLFDESVSAEMTYVFLWFDSSENLWVAVPSYFDDVTESNLLLTINRENGEIALYQIQP